MRNGKRGSLPAWAGIAVLLAALALAGTMGHRDAVTIQEPAPEWRIGLDAQGEPQLVPVIRPGMKAWRKAEDRRTLEAYGLLEDNDHEKEKISADDQDAVRLVRTQSVVPR